MKIDITNTIPVLPWEDKYIEEETVMLYSHRVYFKGMAAAIGFNSALALVGLVEQHGEDNVIYIEDMVMKPFIDRWIKAIQLGVPMCVNDLFFSYIGENRYMVEDPATDRHEGGDDETEIGIRRRLQQYYKKNPIALEEDTPYIEERVIQLS